VPSRKAVHGDRIEHELLLACAGVQVGYENVQEIRVYLSKHIDWEYVIRIALKHGIIPLLYKNLARTFPEALPEEVKERLGRYFLANAQRNLLLTGELLKILDFFDKQGILAIPFKGPVLAALAYGDQSLRQFSDLDILIRERFLPSARDLLISMGYRPDPEHQLDFEAHFFHPDDMCVLDLHWGITYKNINRGKDASFAIDLEGLWGRAENISFAGRRVLHFSPEDLLMIRCQDAVKEYWKDSWPQLKWICDIAGIIRTYQDMDWGLVFEEAKCRGNQRLLSLCLLLAKNLLNAPLPDVAQQNLKNDSQVASLISDVGELLFREPSCPNRFLDRKSGIVARNLFCIRLKERPRDRLAYYVRILEEFRRSACETVKNKDSLDLLLVPRSLPYLSHLLFFLYYLFRPIWRTGRNGVKRLKLIRQKLKTARVPSILGSSFWHHKESK
jgi:hypothetical protein